MIAPTIAPLDVSWEQYNVSMLTLALKIRQSGYVPDQIVSIGRGGIPLGDALSRMFKKTMGVIMCSSYVGEGERQQSTLKIAENISITQRELSGKILLVDDLVDSGKTLRKLSTSILQQHPKITEIKTAVIFQKTCTEFKPDFYGEETEEGVWIFLPNEVFDRIPLDKLSPESLKEKSDEELKQFAEEIFASLPESPLEQYTFQ